jgi:hypothetical protein
MKLWCALFIAAVGAASVSAQTSVPKKPEGSMNVPADPGMRTLPDSSAKIPSDKGAIVVPPTTGTEEIVKTPKAVDPKMDDATDDIDRKNRKKSEDKKTR